MSDCGLRLLIAYSGPPRSLIPAGGDPDWPAVADHGRGGGIIAEASLSFLGYGLPPDIPSWGGMLSWDGRRYMEQAPWLALWPGIALTITVYSLNMFGDALRDLLDPRLRGGEGSYDATKVKRKRGLLARLVNPFHQ